MEKKVFYGEYTLRHWIELILEKNIVLPEYQRSFVWKQHQVTRFLKNLKEGSFIPPITIGYLESSGVSTNIIIDGQQRLTSILLGFLGFFPNESAFNNPNTSPLYSSIDFDDTDDDDEPLQWTMKEVTDKGKSRDDILSKLDYMKYEKIDILEESFLDKIFLGFTYIVPQSSKQSDIQKFYCNVFHDINQQGVALQGIESRRSLYYLEDEFTRFFEPNLCGMLKLTQGGKPHQYDYVRALAFLSEYKKTGNTSSIAKGCRSKEEFEIYYENYINAVICDDDDLRFGKFSQMIDKTQIEERINRLKCSIEILNYNDSTFPSIIDADTMLFGLIYNIMFCGTQINSSKIIALKGALNTKITSYKGPNNPHVKSPNGLKYIRERIKDSIDIYNKYFV